MLHHLYCTQEEQNKWYQRVIPQCYGKMSLEAYTQLQNIILAGMILLALHLPYEHSRETL